jgi:3-dehydroquinate dehydratase/shikimate dehydrogenase
VTTTPLLCATITAPTTAELRRRRDLVTDADLVELRIDSVDDPDVAASLHGRRLPVIVTCRAKWEGGGFVGSEEERHRLLAQALDLGADYVDVEWRAGFDDLVRRDAGRRIVLSSHDFGGVPEDLASRAAAMRATGAAVIKIAVKAGRLSDCVPLLELGRSFTTAEQRPVLIAMGEAGLATRILASRFGSAWTYAGGVLDVGQVSARRLLDMFRFRSIDDRTAVYGVVGLPVAHSVSPAMHNAAFTDAGVNAVYLPLPAADTDDFLAFADALDVRGASVTIPYKLPLMDRVQQLDPLARKVGALNTLKRGDDGWCARNTDVGGFLQPLRDRRVSLQGCRAAILGAGGSARAVAVGLASEGALVTVCARDRSKAQSVAALVGGTAGSWPPAPGSWDILVNCTPIGMHPRMEQSPLPPPKLARGLVYDLIYNPAITRLLRDAATAGADTIGGLDMLVAQAREQFEWWTGVRPSASVMRTAASRRLSEFNTDEDHLV